MAAATTVHVLASMAPNTTIISTKQIEEEALCVRDAATRLQRWETLVKFNLLQSASPLLPLIPMTLAHPISTVDPLYDPPPTPDMTLIEPFQSTDFATLLGQNLADPDTRPRKRRRLDKDTLHHIIPEVRIFVTSHSLLIPLLIKFLHLLSMYCQPPIRPSHTNVGIIATVFSHTLYTHPPPTATQTQTCRLESRPSNQTLSDSSSQPLLRNYATRTAVWRGSSPFVGCP